ncbi:biotin carboxyl carrier protein [Rubrobacter xylanophilus DSM 9941]|mgnify:CR=1 FL=1|uniref:Biotin carboxyl carrier protein of acetyl-CoA carboxylase n=1 Tax=Rubrobacter xylanophilus (strain DSM 9941 / JCM 11954 / NBRC 16129 / PRD-1) TaxID=266117 RepID=Q1B012_RUBXD|nr:acetyl-CoA carboxylase biotin carboxyl carrier protein [Rubrobacter xylanophilus]ABG03016.1 biotin carboxyl carrier protein [Rubrobacter xylanophilus DSM 9941]
MQEIDEKNRREAAAGPLPLEEVGRLVELLRSSGVGEISVRRGELEISVKALPEARPVQAAPAAPAPAPAAEGGAEEEESGLHAVRSPLVGTFYRAPAPGEEPYVEVGDRVSAGQTLCIVEAMKLMNEIPADVSGEVVEVLVQDGQGVEYDQPLFRIRPEG